MLPLHVRSKDGLPYVCRRSQEAAKVYTSGLNRTEGGADMITLKRRLYNTRGNKCGSRELVYNMLPPCTAKFHRPAKSTAVEAQSQGTLGILFRLSLYN